MRTETNCICATQGYLIVDIDDHALRKNQEINKFVGYICELTRKPCISIARSIVSAQLCPNNTARSEFCYKYPRIRHRRAHFDFGAKFSIELHEESRVAFDEFFIYQIFDARNIEYGLRTRE
jgi:hypothetical protein